MKKALILLILLSAGVCAQAQIITIAIEATVRQIFDDADLLEGAIAIDDIITGTYTYNTDTPDTHGSLYVGDYYHYDATYGVSLTSNSLEFKTDPDNVNFLMEIINNDIVSGKDHYLFHNYNNLSLLSGIGVDHISWQLDDPTGTAISSTALPSTAPILEDWQSLGGIYIRSEKIGVNYDQFHIYADVTSAILVPEPAAIMLFGIGSLLIRKRKT